MAKILLKKGDLKSNIKSLGINIKKACLKNIKHDLKEKKMVIKKENVITEQKPAPFNGNGEIVVRHLLNGEQQMKKSGRVFAHTTVFPGSKIGFHNHSQESETYYILSGTALLSDNGKEVKLTKGDVAYTPPGEGHSIEAIGDEPVEMIALIIYNDN